MAITVLIDLGNGDLENGFPWITIQLFTENTLQGKFIASLPENKNLTLLYKQWIAKYKELLTIIPDYKRQIGRSRSIDIDNDFEFNISEKTNYSEQDIKFYSQNIIHEINELTEKFSKQFNNYLEGGIYGVKINELMQLILTIKKNNKGIYGNIQVILETQNDTIQRLPWHCWNFCKDQEIGLSLREYIDPKYKSRKNIRILAIIGNVEGINAREERNQLEKIENLKKAKVNFVINPDLEQLKNKLSDNRGWDILFFAGHSKTEFTKTKNNETKSQRGIFQINHNKYIGIKDLKKEFSIAKENGLKLAIFNSCDGLGLATELAELNTPCSIVMREPVPNFVAQRFFEYFLEGFANEGLSLAQAVSKARNQLSNLKITIGDEEILYPSASWMPVICQNPLVESPTWEDLKGRETKYGSLNSLEKENQNLKQKNLNKKNKQQWKNRIFRVYIFIIIIGIIGLGWQRHKAVNQKITVLAEYSNIITKQNSALLDGLIASIKVAKNMKNNLLLVNFLTKTKVVDVLQRSVLGETWKESNRLEGHKESVIDLTISLDGKWLATASHDNTVKIWNINGELRHTIYGHTDWINSVAISPNGEWLASASNDKTIKIWHKGQSQKLEGHTDLVNSVAISPNGEWLASASDDKTIKIWSIDGKLLYTLYGHTDWVNSVAISPNGEWLASASDDKTIKIWSIDGKLLYTLYGHTYLVNSVAISPNGEWLASASNDKTVKIWSVDGKLLHTIYGHTDKVNSVAISPNGEWLASASNDKTVKIWSVDGKLLHTIYGHTDKVNSVIFSSDGEWLASVSDDKTVKFWSKDSQLCHTLDGYRSSVRSVAISPNGEWLASASDDKTIKIWSVDGKLLHTLDGHTNHLNSVAISSNGKWLASASDNDNNNDSSVKFWSKDGKLLHTLDGYKSRIKSLVISSDDKWLVTAHRDDTVKIRDIDGNEIKTIESIFLVNSVAISPNGKWLATASNDKTVKIWSIDGNLLYTLEGHTDWVNSVAISPDGKWLATASNDKTVKIWSIDGKLLHTLYEHTDWVNSVAISPNGKWLATASNDKTVKIWSIDGNLLYTLEGHTDWVNSVAISPDGKWFATSSDDRSVKLWNLDLDFLLEKGCKRIENYLKYNPNISEDDRHLCDDINNNQSI